MAATNRVLHTAELLEMILVEVDMRTLLLAQRIDTYWKDAIADSPKLQKKLFKSPATSSDLITLKMVSVCPDPRLIIDSSALQITPENLPVAAFRLLNPLLYWHSYDTVFPASMQRTQPSILLKRHDDLPGRRMPSWHHMLVVQPATVDISLSYTGPSGPGRRQDGTIRLGEVLALVRRGGGLRRDTELICLEPTGGVALTKYFWEAVEREEVSKGDGKKTGQSTGAAHEERGM